MPQVSGNKVQTIQPSKNMGTVINNEVSGNKIDAVHEYKKITNVLPTQVDGQDKMTNYMGINDEGMDIMAAKKITGNELNVQTNPTVYDAKATTIHNANKLIAKQEADAKAKHNPSADEPTPEMSAISLALNDSKENYKEGSELVKSDAVLGSLIVTGGNAPIELEFNDDEINGVDNESFNLIGDTLKVADEALTEKIYKFSIKATDNEGKEFIDNLQFEVFAADED